MNASVEKLRGTPSGVPGYFISGNDRTRALYARWKEFANRGAIAPRRQLARTSTPAAETFAIPSDAGYRLFPPGTFDEVPEIVQIAKDCVEEFAPELKTTKKAQLKQGLLPTETLNLDSPHLRFALRPEIIESVSQYLGVVPILADIDVWYSIFTGRTPSNSMLYHCDTNDTTQIKVFIYSTEVTEDDGPLVVIDAQDSRMIREKLGYTYEGKRKRVTDEQVSKLISGDKEHPIVGPPGTAAFVDSSKCFHYGSRVSEGGKSRILTIIQYFTPTAFVLPVDYRQKAPYRHLDSEHLTEMQRLVLGVR